MQLGLLIILGSLLAVSCKKQEIASSEESAATPPKQLTARSASKSASPRPTDDAPAVSAIEAALAIQSPTEKDRALAQIAWNAIETEPALAHEAFRHLTTDSPEKIRLIQHYAMRLAEENPDQALAWANALPSTLEAATAINQIALVIAAEDPPRAAKLLADAKITGREHDVAAVQVIQRWATKSAADAAAWVSRFEAGPIRDAGIREIAQKWLPADAKAAFTWIETTKDPQLRAEIARALEGMILKAHKETREQWRAQVPPSIQADLLQQHESARAEVKNDLIPEDEP